MVGTTTVLQNAANLQELIQMCGLKDMALVHFWASWCEPCKQMDEVVATLVNATPGKLTGIRVEAEVVDAASMQYNITSVPTVVIVKGVAEVDRVEGADPAALQQAVQKALGGATAAATAPAAPAAGSKPGLDAHVEGRIKYLLSQHPVVLFMKGSVEAPRCGFSSRVVKALTDLQSPIHGVDILQDESIRQGLKIWSEWPTYPQLYVKGELVGGCDIVEEMKANGELESLLKAQLGPNYKQTAQAAPSQPAAPTAAAAAPAEDLNTRLEKLVNSQSIMLFMKGSPAEPRCGFSRKVASALQSLNLQFGYFDILSDEDVRQGLKAYSNWPTYPQLYVKGELMGGCDIILQLQESNELGSTIDEMLHRT